MEESQNWLKMPHDLMANILERLGVEEILNSAVKVCTTWWRISKDPAMWKVIKMHKQIGAWEADHLEALTKQAVHLSSGELIDISLEWFGSDELLDHIVLRSSKLNSLCLTNCYNITSRALGLALKKVPKLEKLHISYTSSFVVFIDVSLLNCPHLKSFKLDKARVKKGFVSNDDALAIAKNMPELRHLQLYGNAMSNIGLQAILDGCLYLESLDVRTCYNIKVDGNEVKLCMKRIKNFKGPDDSIENCGFHPRIVEYDEDFDDDYYYVDVFDDDVSDYYD